ncbi:MAG: low molecular weight phosphotyrosine protein phosphatase [Bacteroidetes bacterium]|nr:MAG: low molecular weight phosphotyrosine protein phosphatase [Bacteroidota bacterium]
MQKYLMVCLGNICRSPMAEGIVAREFSNRGINIQIDSAGTAAYHIGEGADSRAQVELRKHDIDISNERAQKFVPAHFSEYDMIFAMDKQNYLDIVAQARNKKERDKVVLFMELSMPGQDISVPDPYYGGDEGFEEVYKMIKLSAEKLVDSDY